ncbi:MAG: DUF5688 family protein [Eubacterium sp.]|nr:DUF5688 family protein [Eubacterium sp.]
MNREDFSMIFADEIRKKLGPEYTVLDKVRRGINGSEYIAVAVQKEGTDAEVFLDPAEVYKAYATYGPHSMAGLVLNAVESIKRNIGAVGSVQITRDKILSTVYYQMRSSDYLPFPACVPVPGMDGVVLVPFLPTKVAGKKASIDLTLTDLQSRYQISNEELHAAAAKNTAEQHFFPVQKLGIYLSELGADSSDGIKSPIILVRDETDLDAAPMGPDGFLSVCKGLDPGQYYIIPSSVHELLLLPRSDVDSVSYLQGVIRDVNDHILSSKERLSYNLYEYDHPGAVRTVQAEAEAEEQIEKE